MIKKEMLILGAKFRSKLQHTNFIVIYIIGNNRYICLSFIEGDQSYVNSNLVLTKESLISKYTIFENICPEEENNISIAGRSEIDIWNTALEKSIDCILDKISDEKKIDLLINEIGKLKK